jgi:4-oxalocrotonate tautomerase family enzyme
VPIVQIHMLAGRSSSAKQVLVEELTAAVERSLGSSPDRIQVLVTEYAEGDWTVAGQPLTLPESDGS